MDTHVTGYTDNVPRRGDGNFKDAKRVSAHKEDQVNKLAPVNNSMPTPKMGKKGIRGDGQTV